MLPFDNMSGDPEQDYFADGMSEDLITGLARIRWLFVIARNSTFVYKNRILDVKQVARELGVRYVLEGSVRRAGTRLRISAQLIDAVTGAHHWAERYDRELGDIFAVQDEITASVAARDRAARACRRRDPHAVALHERSRRLGTGRACANAILAHDQRGLAAVRSRRCTAPPRPTRITRRRAACLGFCLVFAAHMGWTNRDRDLIPGREHAARAIALDDRDPVGTHRAGYWALMERRTEECIVSLRRALDFNPNSAAAHAHLGHGLAFSGRDSEAIVYAQNAIRLSPLDPLMAMFLGSIAVAHYTAGRYAEAIDYTTQAARLRPGFQGPTACVARASRKPDESMKRAPILRPCGASSRGFRWIGSGPMCPTRLPN